MMLGGMVVGESPIQARHLLICREVIYDPFDSRTPYSLRGVYTALRPDDLGYPWCVEELWAYVEVFGEPGRYLLNMDVVPLTPDGTADAGPSHRVMALKPVRVRPEFVTGARFQLFQVSFEAEGLYEFRLHHDGFDEMLTSQRVYLLEK